MNLCKYCGGGIGKNHNVMAGGECFTCWHWRTNYEADLKESQDFAIINGHHYRIGDENASKFWRGFAGQKFIIEFKDERIITTTNLWHQGEISPTWRMKMPDNAKFNPVS